MYTLKEFNSELNLRWIKIINLINKRNDFKIGSLEYKQIDYSLRVEIIVYRVLCSKYELRFRRQYNKSLLFADITTSEVLVIYLPFKIKNNYI